MPFGPGGTFTAISLPGSFNPADAGQQATPEAWNALLADLTSAGLSQTITKNGLTTPTANLPMGGFRWTGVGDATARTMFASAGQVQDNALAYGTAGGTADAATLTLSPAILTYKAGQIFSYLAPGTTTITNPEINVNGLGSGVVVQAGGGALPVGAIISGGLTTVAVIDAATPVFQLITGRTPLSTAGGTLTGILTMSGAAINEAKGANIASATTTDIGAATGNFVHITGTTTITGLGTVQAGTRRVVVFDGILTLTHNGTSLILPTGANITTAAGDCAIFESEGSGNWRCVNYMRATGVPVGAVYFTNTLGANVALNNTASWFTGPTVAQGSTGVFLAMGTVTINAAAAGARVSTRLSDGTNIKASTTTTWASGTVPAVVTETLTAVFVNPPGNIRIEANNADSTGGGFVYNQTGQSADCTLVVQRIG